MPNMSADPGEPDLAKSDFRCPTCGKNGRQVQIDLYPVPANQSFGQSETPPPEPDAPTHPFLATQCAVCDAYAIWYMGELKWPPPGRPSSPPACMPEHARRAYEDAGEIFSYAPRASVALLLLALALMCEAPANRPDDLVAAIEADLRKHGNTSQALPARLRALVPKGDAIAYPGAIEPYDPANNYAERARDLFTLLADIAKALFE